MGSHLGSPTLPSPETTVVILSCSACPQRISPVILLALPAFLALTAWSRRPLSLQAFSEHRQYQHLTSAPDADRKALKRPTTLLLKEYLKSFALSVPFNCAPGKSTTSDPRRAPENTSDPRKSTLQYGAVVDWNHGTRPAESSHKL